MSELELCKTGTRTGTGTGTGAPLLQLLAEYMDADKCIDELLKQLEEERRNVRREKLAVARLQREVARSKSEGTMREKLILELEDERRLRLDSEKRLRDAAEETELGRAQMVSLQQQFSRMEETVRSLLQNQGVLEQTAVDTVDIMKAYKDKLSEEAQKQEPPDAEPDAGRAEEEEEEEEEEEVPTKVLVERLKALEDKNSALALENETQREQYERCLDEVANQVVQALLTQKDLREECVKLRTRVFDLEQQNRALGILFQQRIKPASDLLLQKLHSRILDLSAADLLLEPERSRAFLLSRSSEAPPTQEAPVKLGFPLVKCLSQLSLAVAPPPPPPPPYPRSSCSSSELSLSSACSDFSSGSYTWNDGRSCGKSSLTWEKRLSLGSSAPGNIGGGGAEETQPPPPPPPPPPPLTRRKESHILEGLRRLQRRRHRSSSSSSSKVSRSAYKDCMNSNEGIYSLGGRAGGGGGESRPERAKRFSYDSDDADDELARSGGGDNVPTKDGWSQGQRRSHSISDSLCSWEGTPPDAKPPPPPPPCGYDSKERPEKLLSFINSFLPEGRRPSAFSRPSKLHRQQAAPQESAERDAKRPAAPQGRTQSADGRPRPFGPVGAPAVSQSEESVLAVFDADGEPIQLRGADDPDERPTRQKAAGRNYSVLESPEKPSEFLLRTGRTGSAERRKLVRPAGGRAAKGLSVPAAATATAGSRIPGRNKAAPPAAASPLKVSKGCSTDDKSPSSAVRMSRFLKAGGSCSQSPRAAAPAASKWGKTSSSCSPHLSRRHLDYAETPTRDKHCETGKNKLRSPSPPPPPGRSASLLIRPDYEASPPPPQRAGAAPPTAAAATARGPPPSYHTSLLPNMQGTLPVKDRDGVDMDAGYGTAPQKLVDKGGQRPAAAAQTPTKATPRRTKDYLPPANSGCPSSKNVPPPYGALRGSALQTASKRGSAHEGVQKPAAAPQDAAVTSPNAPERSPKTRIPMGFKAFLKSPSSAKNVPPVPPAVPPVPAVPAVPPTVPGKQEKDHINAVSKETAAQPPYDSPVKLREEEPAAAAAAACDGGGGRGSQLFARSISVGTKPHLKPALGMNGAKARSQSFSANYGGGGEAAGRTRTQIITNSGERGSSLSRQSSLEAPPADGAAAAAARSPRSRLSHYGGMTAAHLPSPRKDAFRPPFEPGSPEREAEAPPGDGAGSPAKTAADGEEKKSSIEEKVMMGIERNLQKCQQQQQEKGGEAKQRTGPSLANWFGLRRSKLPAPGAKRAEPPKAKEPRIGSVLKGRRDRKKEAQDNLVEVNNKLSSIMDHCNNQMGHISSALIAKDQLVRELLGRTAAGKGNAVTSAPEICRKHEQTRAEMEICGDTATLLLSQKVNLRVQTEGGAVPVPDPACQDHVIGSASQMRTLDSGIGTFPPPGRGSEEAAATAAAAADLQVPSPSKPRPHAGGGVAHSLSDPAVTCGGAADARSRLPKPASSDAIRTKRLSVGASLSISSVSPERKTKDEDAPGERPLRACTYPGSSSSDTETEPDPTGDSGGRNDDTLKRSEEAGLSIMDLCPHDVFQQFQLLHADKDIPAERPPSLRFSLDSLNKLNHGGEPTSSASASASSASLTPARRPTAAALDPGGSLSDSLYDSFSSCTSQGSNDA